VFASAGSDYHNDAKKGVKNPRELGECGLTMEEFLAIPNWRAVSSFIRRELTITLQEKKDREVEYG
jgi:hypothetical protein